MARTTDGKVSFAYGSSFSGSDTLTATAEGGSNPSQSASITWTVPASTARSTLTILNIMPTFMRATITTGAAGSTPRGSLTYRDSHVSLSNVQLQSLVVSGPTATLYGTAQVNGTPVSFILTANTSQRTVELTLSNGYDSGPQSVWIAFVR